jgi:hypothetical protein
MHSILQVVTERPIGKVLSSRAYICPHVILDYVGHNINVCLRSLVDSASATSYGLR